MKSKAFIRYYCLSCLGVLVASFYPLWMGVKVITDMIVNGTVLKEEYPKYIIPYTPICISLLICVLLMPLFFRVFKRLAFLGSAITSSVLFFSSELLFEQRVVVSSSEIVSTLEDWQMFMCYIPPDSVSVTHKTQTAVDILMGNYNPAFKLHFYVISIVLILTILGCIYGFAQIIAMGKKERFKPLILQSVCSFIFLVLCVLACFTAFWRDGSLQVSPLSAFLMSLFFITLGVVSGLFLTSFVLGKSKLLSVFLPAVLSSFMTLVMYIGEMILLNGHLYSFGSGFIFKSIPRIILAPIDILIIIISGLTTAVISSLFNKKQ